MSMTTTVKPAGALKLSGKINPPSTLPLWRPYLGVGDLIYGDNAILTVDQRRAH
jgi:hypothetical protein